MKTMIKKVFSTLLIALLTLIFFFWYVSGTPMGFFKFVMVYASVDQVFMKSTNHSAMFEGALKGIVRSLNEKHSTYLSKEETDRLKQSMDGTYSGVGIYMGGRDGAPQVMSVIEDLPAEAAGVRAGDVIISINGESTESMSLDEASHRVRGKEGTTVTLGIERGSERLTISMERKKITLPSVKAKMLDGDVAYIRITQFGDHAGEEFKKAYEEMSSKGMKRMVLDLRNNPGGLLTAAQDIGSYLVPKGTIVSIKARHGIDEVYESEGLGKNLPLVVIIDKGSASASEIIAGAVQDRKSGIILGEQSYGKGTVQTVLSSFEGESIKLTIAQYRTPNERIIDGEGITPDIVYPMDPSIMYGTPGDIQLERALSVVRGMPLP